MPIRSPTWIGCHISSVLALFEEHIFVWETGYLHCSHHQDVTSILELFQSIIILNKACRRGQRCFSENKNRTKRKLRQFSCRIILGRPLPQPTIMTVAIYFSQETRRKFFLNSAEEHGNKQMPFHNMRLS